MRYANPPTFNDQYQRIQAASSSASPTVIGSSSGLLAIERKDVRFDNSIPILATGRVVEACCIALNTACRCLGFI